MCTCTSLVPLIQSPTLSNLTGTSQGVRKTQSLKKLIQKKYKKFNSTHNCRVCATPVSKLGYCSANMVLMSSQTGGQ